MQIRIRTIVSGVIVASVAMVVSGMGASAANALGPPAGGNPIIYTMLNKTKTTNYVDTAHPITKCIVASAKVGCSISKSTSTSSTVSVSLGATKEWVSSELSGSWTWTTSVTVSCHTIGQVKVGQSLVAYPVGTRYSYKIRSQDAFGVTPAQTSGTLHAFHASSGIACKIVG